MKVSFRSPKQRGSTRPSSGRRILAAGIIQDYQQPTGEYSILPLLLPLTYSFENERPEKGLPRPPSFRSRYPHRSYIRRNLIENLTRKVDAISYVQRARLAKRNDIRNSQSVLYIINYNLWYSRKFSNYEINRNREKTFF